MRDDLLTLADAAVLSAALDLDVDDVAVCPACLSLVFHAFGSGDNRAVAGAITRVATDLWEEGLEEPVRTALAHACARGVAHAAEAVATIDARGPRSRVVRAIVRRLAADLFVRTRGDWTRLGCWQRWLSGAGWERLPTPRCVRSTTP